MKDLVEAFTIFLKYSQEVYPTHCEHDVMCVCVSPSLVSDEDKKRLCVLGFKYGGVNDDGDMDDEEECEYGDCFYSYKYGSC
jgi:hypothetical protein